LFIELGISITIPDRYFGRGYQGNPMDMMAHSEEFDLVIVSDLHLGEGRNPTTKKFSLNEDFFFDEVFGRFLIYLEEESKRRGRKWRLIIAGDMIDFLQMTTLPEPGEVDFEISKREKRFGLGTEEVKTVWKLKRIMNGHWRFFQSLANFLNQEHRVAIIPGNHDVEFVYEKVQATFKRELSKYLTAPPKAKKLEGNLEFLPWFYFEPDHIFVEHGHQYDALNSFDFFLCPFRTIHGKTVVDLPSGSFFVRYFFNRIEKIDPFADNIKPVTKYVSWAVKHRLLSVGFIGILCNYILFLFEALKKRRPLSDQEKNLLSQRQMELLKLEAQRFNLAEDQLRSIKDLWIPSSISNDSFCKVLWKFFLYDRPSLHLNRAKKIQKILKVKKVVFGHTHDPDLRGLPSDRERFGEYVNSGTWTTVFSEEEKLLREEKEFAYVQILKQPELKMKLLKWKDELGEGQRVNLFQI
jgi:UDP-2,3-diacylglucosamine pyrophosphatase LpxH